MDNRAVSPVVGKALEAGIVTLYVGLLTATLYGGAVPDYRTTAGAEVGDRVLSKSAERIQQAVPATGEHVRIRTRVSLPRTIRGERYEIRATEGTLVLDHPNDAVSGTVRLALPATVDRVRGGWSSTDRTVVVVESDPDGLVVRLTRGGER